MSCPVVMQEQTNATFILWWHDLYKSLTGLRVVVMQHDLERGRWNRPDCLKIIVGSQVLWNSDTSSLGCCSTGDQRCAVRCEFAFRNPPLLLQLKGSWLTLDPYLSSSLMILAHINDASLDNLTDLWERCQAYSYWSSYEVTLCPNWQWIDRTLVAKSVWRLYFEFEYANWMRCDTVLCCATRRDAVQLLSETFATLFLFLSLTSHCLTRLNGESLRIECLV